MGIGAVLVSRPAGRPDGDERGAAPSLGSVLGQLRELSSTAAQDAALFGFAAAADFAGDVEEIARTLEYLQIVAAGAVDRTRKETTEGAGTGEIGTGGFGAGATGPGGAGGVRAGDDGYRKTGDFLRDRLQITAAEAHRRLSLARTVLPRTGFTGEPLPPLHEELAAALAAGTVPSRSATIITLALDRVRPLCDPDTRARMEHALTRTAIGHDPDFLARIARRWTDGHRSGRRRTRRGGPPPTPGRVPPPAPPRPATPRNLRHHRTIRTPHHRNEHRHQPPHHPCPRRPAGGAGTVPPDAASGGAGRSDSGNDSVGAVAASLDWRSRPQRLLDGLIGACKVALASGGLPATGGLRPQIMVTIDYQDLLTRLGRSAKRHALPDGVRDAAGWPRSADREPAGGPGQQANGSGPFGFTGTGTLGFTGTGTMAFTGPVTAATIRKIACDADIIPALLGSQGRILDIGRTTRIFPPHLRKAITARDQGCAFPGCTIPAPWCEAHHITYWSRGGTTSADNGVLLCSHHHHLIHKEHWTIQPRAGIPWFIPPPHLDPRQQPKRNHYFRS